MSCSTGNVNGVGQGLTQLLGRLSRQNQSPPTHRAASSNGSNNSTGGWLEIHGHHHHHEHGGGKQLFKQIQSAVTSALQALPTDGTADPNQAIVQAITQVFQNNGITLPSTGTPPPTDAPPTTGTTGDPSTTGSTTPTDPASSTSPPNTPPATTPADTPPPANPPPTSGTSNSSPTGSASDPDGDGDNDGGHVERHGGGRHAFFQTLQQFGITAEQFRQDLLLALKAALNGDSSSDTTAASALPPGSAVDVSA